MHFPLQLNPGGVLQQFEGIRKMLGVRGWCRSPLAYPQAQWRVRRRMNTGWGKERLTATVRVFVRMCNYFVAHPPPCVQCDPSETECKEKYLSWHFHMQHANTEGTQSPRSLHHHYLPRADTWFCKRAAEWKLRGYLLSHLPVKAWLNDGVQERKF